METQTIGMLADNVFYFAVGAGSHRQLQSLLWVVSGGSGLQRNTEDSMESRRYS